MKKIHLIALFLFVLQIICASNNLIDNETFNKYKDYVNLEYAKIILLDRDCYKNVEVDLKEYNLNNTTSFQNFKKLLKDRKVSDSIINIFDMLDKKSIDFNLDDDDQIDKIISYSTVSHLFSKKLSGQIDLVSRISKGDLRYDINKKKRQVIEMKSLSNEKLIYFLIAIVLLINLLILFLFYYFYLRRYISSKIQALIKSNSEVVSTKNSFSNSNQGNQKDISLINERVKRNEDNLKSINDVVSGLSTAIKNIESNAVIENNFTNVSLNLNTENLRKNIVVFYMATPNSDSSFSAESANDTFSETSTLYKFTVDENNPQKAKFEFISGFSGVRDATNAPQTYTDPVCIPENALIQNAKAIKTIEPGIAQKQGNIWKVTQKAKIRYE